MKDPIKLLVVGVGAYFLYQWWKKQQKPAITTRPMQIETGKTIASIDKEVTTVQDLFDPSKKEKLDATHCGEVAAGMEFSDDNRKYEWILACMQNHGG